MSKSTTTALDHLILFLPCSPSSNTPLIPASFQQNFNLTPGGTHADNLTANTLILLADGCYIELICFLPQQDASSSAIAKHWWGPDVNRKGWTDWCLTTTTSASENYDRVSETHAEPINGGRKRPDGKSVEWTVTFPKGELGGQVSRGRIPFFCHDRTARELRVPIEEKEGGTRHVCGALGVRSLDVIVRDEEEVQSMLKFYSKVVGEGLGHGSDGGVFEVGRVRAVDDFRNVEGFKGPKVIVRLPRNEEEVKRVEQKGFWFRNVVLAALASDEKQAGRRERIDGGHDDVGGLWVEYV